MATLGGVVHLFTPPKTPFWTRYHDGDQPPWWAAYTDPEGPPDRYNEDYYRGARLLIANLSPAQLKLMTEAGSFEFSGKTSRGNRYWIYGPRVTIEGRSYCGYPFDWAHEDVLCTPDIALGNKLILETDETQYTSRAY